MFVLRSVMHCCISKCKACPVDKLRKKTYDAHPKVKPMIDVIIINFLYRVLPTALVS